MIKLVDQSAVKYAMELANTLCASKDNGLEIDKRGAEDLADFIEVLESRFTARQADS